jgi:solute carrier family 50 protein (sugar transporter)
MGDFVLQVVFPTVGVFTGCFMNFAPFRSVLKATRDGNLGGLNATPWVFMLGNCAGWLAYSYLLENMYVFIPNAVGFILSIWLNIQAIKIQYENHRSHEMQTLLINALEDLDRSKHSKINKKTVTEMVQNVIVEDTPPIDMINPVTTAPIVGDDNSEENQTGGNTTATTYDSVHTSTQGDDPDDHYKDDESPNFQRLRGTDREYSMLATETVHEAAEAVMDYASFVWDIAAQRSPAPASHEMMVLAISTFWLFLITLVVFTQSAWDEATRVLLIGLTVNVNLIFFYGAPLSKIATVLETRSSRLIHVPTMVCSLSNGSLWFVYGIAVGDYFIAVPNGFGTVLGVVQFVLCMIFPRHSHHHPYHHHGNYQTILDGNGAGAAETETDGLLKVPSSMSLQSSILSGPKEPAAII